MATNTHSDEPEIDADLVRRLLESQFPQWADLPLSTVESSGTDNTMFRLGEDLAVRMPKVDWASFQVDTEQKWLPRLAPFLSLKIPSPIAMGSPGEGFRRFWSILQWIEGESLASVGMPDLTETAIDLANFICELQHVDTRGGLWASDHNCGRGESLDTRDFAVRNAIESLSGRIDTNAARHVWDKTLRVPGWDRPPVWVHGDLQPGNLLAANGTLCAVIDFGLLGVGDPAVDMLPAWNLFDVRTRAVFREELAVDDATWERGKGWALSVALIALPYYWETNASIVAASLKTLDEVLTDSRRI